MTPRSLLRRLALVSALVLAPVAVGCAAPTEEDAASSAAAQTKNPVYDAVIREGTKVTTDATRTPERSSETHLIGFVRAGDEDEILGQLLSVARWTEIRDAEGEAPFKRAELLSDTGAGATRTVTGKISMERNVTLEVRAVASQDGAARVVRVTNTTAFKHWLAGTVLEANKLVIDVKLIPYEGGVIVDATMRCKLKKMEDKAPELTGAIQSIFDWLE